MPRLVPAYRGCPIIILIAPIWGINYVVTVNIGCPLQSQTLGILEPKGQLIVRLASAHNTV